MLRDLLKELVITITVEIVKEPLQKFLISIFCYAKENLFSKSAA